MPLREKTLLSRVTSVLLSCGFILGTLLLTNAYYLKKSFASKMMSYESEIQRQKVYIRALLQKTEETILETQVALQEIEPALVQEATRKNEVSDKKEGRSLTLASRTKGIDPELERQITKTAGLVKKARALQRKWTAEQEESNPYANAP